MIVLSIIVLCLLLYIHLNDRLNYWQRKNVPYVPCTCYSTIKSLFANPVPFFEYYSLIYKRLSHHKYGGCYMQFRPQFVVRDPDLVKCILTKDFEYFRNRANVNFDEEDPLTNHLFSAPGNLWKALRIHLSPAFTSGKMKYMFDTMKECAEECQLTLQKSVTRGISLNFRDVNLNYTVNVISSTIFGSKTDIHRNADNEFKKFASLLFRFQLRHRLRLVINYWFPFLKRFIFIRLLSADVRNFFVKTVREAIEHRQKTAYRRNDFLQLLMTVNEQTCSEKESNKTTSTERTQQYDLKLTYELMTAQCLLFFVAGFDTSSFTITMALLEMAVNEDIQKAVQDEIDAVIGENENKITYETLKNMPYLHKVIQETLRKYPVLPIISRICTKTYILPDTNIVIKKGTEVIIPVAGIHRDETFYTNPEKFDPERFNKNEIQKRHNYVYLPFGEGPRNCIGSRFGLMTVKLGIVHILKKFRVEKTPETVYPMRFRRNKLISDSDGPVLLKCIPR